MADRSEILAHQVKLVERDLMALRGEQECREFRGNRVQLDLRAYRAKEVHLVPRVLLETLAMMASQELPGCLDQQVPVVLLVLAVNLVSLVSQASVVLLVLTAFLGHVANPVPVESLEPPAELENLETKAVLDHPVFADATELLVGRVLRATRDQLVNLVPWVIKAHKVALVAMVLWVLKECVELAVVQVPRVHLVLKVCLVHRALKVQLVTRVHKVRPAHRVARDRWAKKVQRALLVMTAP